MSENFQASGNHHLRLLELTQFTRLWRACPSAVHESGPMRPKVLQV